MRRFSNCKHSFISHNLKKQKEEKERNKQKKEVKFCSLLCPQDDISPFKKNYFTMPETANSIDVSSLIHSQGTGQTAVMNSQFNTKYEDQSVKAT